MVLRTMDSAFASGQGDRRPCFAGGESSTDAVVVKTVVLPQLHLPRNSLLAALHRGDELMGLLLGPCT